MAEAERVGGFFYRDMSTNMRDLVAGVMTGMDRFGVLVDYSSGSVFLLSYQYHFMTGAHSFILISGFVKRLLLYIIY